MINTVVLMGRLTAAPELKKTQSGLSVCSFTIAIDRSFGEDKKTDFINVVAWRSTAEFICNYFKKGQMIAVEGSIQTRNYEDRDGNKRTVFEVVANNVSFCGKSEQRDETIDNAVNSTRDNKNAAEAKNERFSEYTADDDLPF